MAGVTVTLPKEYGYVLASLTTTFAVSFWHSAWVGRYRRAASVAYPEPYALDTWSLKESTTSESKARYAFNCAQRAHGQFIEHLPVACVGMLVAGVGFPVTSAVLGLNWAVNRVVFAFGYVRGDKEKGSGRLIGTGYLLSEFGWFGLIGYMGWNMMIS